MRKPTVHIVIRNGIVEEAYADCDVDVVVYDLDCPDGDMKEEVERAVAQLPDFAHEVEIL
jgi:hypothetical protein